MEIRSGIGRTVGMRPLSLLHVLVAVSVGAWSGAGQAAAADAGPSRCSKSLVPASGNQLWVDLAGAGALTVVFEAGFGNDSTVWADLAPKVRALGVRTLVYDRAGMGQSTLDSKRAYTFDGDVAMLRQLLDTCGVTGPVLFVGHSYGGAIGLELAAKDVRVAGLVLLDALVPGVWTKEEVQRNLASMRPQYDELRAKVPALAKVAIPWAEAMPSTAAQLNALTVSDALPITDVVAENGQKNPESAKTWREAHGAFTEGHAHRTSVLARGSSHKVMVDQPDLVLSSITSLVEQLRSVARSRGAPAH